MEQPETLRQQIADQLVKLIESHNELLLFTASSCADSFREYEAREVLDWADGKNERGNSINTDFAKEMVDAVFVRVDPEELKTQIDQAIETYTRHMLSESKPYSEMPNKELRALAVDEITEVFFPVVNQKEEQNERETVEEQE